MPCRHQPVLCSILAMSCHECSDFSQRLFRVAKVSAKTLAYNSMQAGMKAHPSNFSVPIRHANFLQSGMLSQSARPHMHTMHHR